MIKVCHMTSAHAPEDVRIFHKECVSLAKAGYDVYLVERGESYEKEGVHIVGVGQPSGGRLTRMTSFAKRVYKAALIVDADIYHLHDPELLPYGLKLKRKGKKVIFDSHENTKESILEKGWIPLLLRKFVYHCYTRYERYICRQLDAVISVTPNIVEYYRRINPMVVQIANFPMYQKEVSLPTFKNKYLVFAGMVIPDWHHHILLEALQKNQDCRYYLCGDGSTEYLERLKAMPAWGQVEYLGKIPHSQVADVLASSYIGVALDSYCRNADWKNGTIGNTKIFEEMMAGLPVVCTDFVLWREFVDRYHCGICVDPDNADEVADAIRYLLDNPEEARKMGENGRRAVREEFNWAVEEKKLLALYEDILKG